jgi:hypothetical protein
MNVPAARPIKATPRPSENNLRISNRELELLEPLLTYTKQTTAPRSNRELPTIPYLGFAHESGFDRCASLFGTDMVLKTALWKPSVKPASTGLSFTAAFLGVD